MMRNSFPHHLQLDAMDCGPTCLRMVAAFYGKTYSLQTLRARSFITREGVSMLGVGQAAESIGFRTSGVKISFNQLITEVPFPCILHWNQSHFVVCYGLKKKPKGYKIQTSSILISFIAAKAVTDGHMALLGMMIFLTYIIDLAQQLQDAKNTTKTMKKLLSV